MSKARQRPPPPESQFKSTQIFDWDAEPSDERPSEFAQSTQFSTLNTTPRRAPPRRRAGMGMKSIIFVALLLLVLGGWGLKVLIGVLRH